MADQNSIKTRTILLVDDHTLFREGMKGLLKQNPMFRVVAEAGTVEDAIVKALELTPDLVPALVIFGGVVVKSMVANRLPPPMI